MMRPRTLKSLVAELRAAGVTHYRYKKGQVEVDILLGPPPPGMEKAVAPPRELQASRADVLLAEQLGVPVVELLAQRARMGGS